MGQCSAWFCNSVEGLKLLSQGLFCSLIPEKKKKTINYLSVCFKTWEASSLLSIGKCTWKETWEQTWWEVEVGLVKSTISAIMKFLYINLDLLWQQERNEKGPSDFHK